ncbi:MAG: TonB-dependent receptor, partial [Elusimicrobiota bacterium]
MRPLFLSALLALCSVDALLGAEAPSPRRVTFTISGKARSERKDAPVRAVSAVRRRQIEERNPMTSADILRDLPGVMVQKTMPGRPAVSIRGFIGKDNLVLIDGVRLNTSKTENVLSLGAVDPESIGRSEVLRGPGSVLYGSDALGGVVMMLPRRREDFSAPAGVSGRLRASYRSADNGRSSRAELSGNWGDFGYLAGFSRRDHGDLNPGGGFPQAVPTAYRERAWDLALDRRAGEVRLKALYQHAEQRDVPRYDQYAGSRRFGSSGAFEEYLYDPMRRDLVLAEALFPELGPLGLLQTKLYWQRQREDTRRRAAGGPTRSEFADSVDTLGARLQAESPIGEAFTLVSGVDGYRDAVSSSRRDRDLRSGAVADKPEQGNYPDGTRYQAAGAFLLGRWTRGEDLRFELGERLSRVELDSNLRNAPFAGRGIREHYVSWTGGGGLSWQACPELGLNAGIWQGFRAPNLNDTVALKTSAQGTDAPADGLRPEKSTGFELGARHSRSSFQHSLTLHYTRLEDILERSPGVYGGLSFIDLDNDGVQDSGESPVFQRRNSGAGYVAGAE